MIIKRALSKKILLILSVTLVLPQIVAADSVYKHTGPEGKIIYSSKPKNALDKPAKLPNIVRGETKSTPPTGLQPCKTHGGINCQAGSDVDGSVICIDGYKDAATRFKFSCTTPRLEIAEISASDESGSFKVYIRNISSVAAESVRVEYKTDSVGKNSLIGSLKIGGYESGEYVYKPSEKFHNFAPPDRAKIKVTCANCL